jgi:hypothetical protein
MRAVMRIEFMDEIEPENVSPKQICEPVRWKGRDAVRLANGIVELISLNGGGHLAAFRFLDGGPSENVLWEAPWPTLDPCADWSEDQSRIYGPAEIGKYLAGYTGHALCLDYFGDPTAEQAAAGLSLHGEAAMARWRAMGGERRQKAQCRWEADLPVSQLKLEREIHLVDGQSAAYIQETVSSKRDAEHTFNWVQHVAFGPPFLSEGVSTLITSAESGMTLPLGYEGRSLLADNDYFPWPCARRAADDGSVDLRRPFTEKGKGFLAGVRLDPEREIEFLLAVNWKLRLGVGYCFRRRDFPWMTLWEENCARDYSPWNGATQARGMEFGTTPLPLAANGGLSDQRFSGTPRGCRIAAHGKKTARYILFLFAVPAEIQSIESVTPMGNSIFIEDESGTASFSVPAEGCEKFLAEAG